MEDVNEHGDVSPVPKKHPITIGPQALTFAEALNEVLLGKRVTKEEWDNEETYTYMDKGKDNLMIHVNGKNHQWILSEGDMTGEDYFVIN